MKKSLAPQNIDEHNWYYEDSYGITLIHEVMNGEKHLRTDDIFIPWRLLKKSYARKYD